MAVFAHNGALLHKDDTNENGEISIPFRNKDIFHVVALNEKGFASIPMRRSMTNERYEYYEENAAESGSSRNTDYQL